jgi:hypothetical protein
VSETKATENTKAERPTLDIEKAKHRIFNRIHRGGEQIKNDLLNWIQDVIETEAWRDATRANGEKFETVGDWLVASYPFGPGCGKGRYAIKYDELIVLCDARAKLKDLLIKHRPKGKPGPQGKEASCVDDINETIRRPTGTSRLCIEQRLQRDHPEIWQDYLDGKYKSARAAGIAAGFIKDNRDPVAKVKTLWGKMTKKQQRELIEWLGVGAGDKNNESQGVRS